MPPSGSAQPLRTSEFTAKTGAKAIDCLVLRPLHTTEECEAGMADQDQVLQVERLGAVMRLTLNRPKAMNAINVAMLAALSEALELRSEEHTSELQSLRHLVCRLLLE